MLLHNLPGRRKEKTYWYEKVLLIISCKIGLKPIAKKLTKSSPIRIADGRERLIFPESAMKLNPRLRERLKAKRLTNSNLPFFRNISSDILLRGLKKVD